MTRSATPAPEFSRPIRADQVGAEGRSVVVEADAEERRRLAERFDLVELPALRAELRLDPMGGGEVALSGRFRAEVVQRCVVTDAPIAATVEGAVERRFAPAEELGPPPREEEVTADEAEPPEPIIDDVIEVGEAVAEELALDLDPFPRAPGVAFEGYEAAPPGKSAESPEERGPFAELARLRRQRNE